MHLVRTCCGVCVVCVCICCTLCSQSKSERPTLCKEILYTRDTLRERLSAGDCLSEREFLFPVLFCKNLLCSVQCVKTSLPSSRSTRKRASVSLLPIMRPCCSVHPGVLRPVRETRCPIIIHQLIILVNLEIWNRKITVAVCEVDYGPCRQCWYQPSLCHTPVLLPPSSSRCPSVSK